MIIQTPAARSTDPIGSHLAADEINENGSRHVQQSLVAGFLEDAYKRGVVKRNRGVTSRELAAMYGEDRYMIARRLPELVTAKQAVQGPKEETRKCDISGRQCREWWPSDRVMDLIDKGEA
ncbi:hypothetical protein [Marinomonas atlantica]|uniref:hypothetical protein n=1 Tax=Marinomonas atlantica TaxID=1806668 RepID=UPI000833BCA7|nr:hypothetical protein [Marinomonas atlantica]